MTRFRIVVATAGMVVVALLAVFASMVRITWQPDQPVADGRQAVVIAQPHKQIAPMPARLRPQISQGRVAADPNDIDHPLLTIPVRGISRADIRDSWGDPRQNGLRQHHGTDIMAPKDTPVFAAASGTIDKLFWSAGGGITAYVRSPNRVWSYYYAHLGSYAPGLHEGQQVIAGDLIGFVGDTGNAGIGNYHLHFGMSRMQPADGWWKGEAVNPYRLLAGRGRDG